MGVAMKPTALAFLVASFGSQICFASPQNDRQSEIAEIRSQLNAFDARLQRLESDASPQQNRNSAKTAAATAAWMNPSSWATIRRGMSRAQVEAILGKSTSSKIDVISYVILIYQGDVPGSGIVSGNVRLDSEDRVVLINPPVF
jgi:hypothetical protein